MIGRGTGRTTYRRSAVALAADAFVVAAVAVGAAALSPAGAAGRAASVVSSPSTPGGSGLRSFYVALGDSVPVWDGTHSYAHLLENHYVSSVPGLVLEDMAVSEATTTSMLDDGQYRSALRFLRKHPGHIALITIDIGGNDLVYCATPSGINHACVKKGLATVDRNLSTMLAGLSAAAPSVPIVGMTYYDPYLGDWLAGGQAQTLVLDSLSVVTSLNHELVSLYGGASTTADVAATFRTQNHTTVVGSPWGKVPVDVDRACSWLDITCRVGQTEGFGDDPNIAGQRKIAATFERTIGPLRAP